jgi:hypothetical protein
VNWKIQYLEVKPTNTFNADQTNMYFSMANLYTLAERGAQTVSVKGADSTARLTVMLCASMDGGKMPAYIIYKGSTNKKGRITKELQGKVGYPEVMEYAVQPKAWMEEDKMIDWIDRVWGPYINNQQNDGVTYLILDECRTHLTGRVRCAFLTHRTEVDYIPGGYTSKLQMLDVGVNKPFKNNIRNEFDEWLVNARESIKPHRQDVAKWINNAWNSITVNNIKNSWRNCGIKFEEQGVEATISEDEYENGSIVSGNSDMSHDYSDDPLMGLPESFEIDTDNDE